MRDCCFSSWCFWHYFMKKLMFPCNTSFQNVWWALGNMFDTRLLLLDDIEMRRRASFGPDGHLSVLSPALWGNTWTKKIYISSPVACSLAWGEQSYSADWGQECKSEDGRHHDPCFSLWVDIIWISGIRRKVKITSWRRTKRKTALVTVEGAHGKLLVVLAELAVALLKQQQ